MEIKIKDANGYIDADWTIEDGVMIVSPKELKFKPKEGDVITCTNPVSTYTLILKEVKDNIAYSYAVLLSEGWLFMDDWCNYKNPRPATEEERNKLFKALADKGLEWDVKERKLVKVKWKPSEGELYYYPYSRIVLYDFEVGCSRWDNDEIDQAPYEKGWVFPFTKQGKADCHKLVDKLNEAINSVKP